MSDINSDFSALDHAAIQFAEEDRISPQAAQEIPARTGTDAILEWLRAARLGPKPARRRNGCSTMTMWSSAR